MSRSVQRSFCLALLVFVTACSSPTTIRIPTTPDPIADAYIVTYAESFGAASRGDALGLANALAASVDASDVTPLPLIDGVLLRGIDPADVAALTRDPRVASIEPDALVSTAAVPWGLDRVDQRALPLDGAYAPERSGAGVVIAIVDTGIRANHPEFGDRVAPGMTMIADGHGTDDCEGHGTHVAGIAAGAVSGIARGATLVPIRVLGCDGTGSVSDVVRGLEWLLAHREGPTVANLSLTGAPSTALDLAVRSLHEAGVTVVVAAGNDPVGRGGDACRFSPARADAAITVAASTRGDHRAPFSFAGPCVDLFAPGEAIPSADVRGGSRSLSGTSMAAPHVAGAAALLLSAQPTASPRVVAEALTASATRDVIREAGIGSPNRLLYVALHPDLPGEPEPDTDPAPPPGPRPEPEPCSDCRVEEGNLTAGGLATFGEGAFPAGRHVAVLEVPPGADFDLYLERLAGSRWAAVDRAATSRRSESVAFDAPAGTYRWRVQSFAGRGAFELGFSFTPSADPGDGACEACVRVQSSLSAGRTWVSESFDAGPGAHEAWLTGPAGADLDLYLDVQDAGVWVSVARAAGTEADEHLRRATGDGTYRWRVVAYRGGGDFTLVMRRP